MSPRFATALLRTRTRGLSGPTLVALALIAIVVAGHVRDDGRLRPLARRHLQGGAQDERDDADARSQLERLVVDLETGVRGYMLTDDTRFLEPYQRGRSSIDVSVAELERLSPPELRAAVDAHRRATSTPTSPSTPSR